MTHPTTERAAPGEEGAGRPGLGGPGDLPPTVEADAARISEMIDRIALIGADRRGGVSRLAYSDEERRAHRLVAEWLRDLGLEVREDPVGNTLARRPGEDPTAPVLALGSHLDSVPQGGRFDGIAGVVGMVELMRLLRDSGVSPAHPVMGVVFAAEEGARFGEPCIGSKLVAGGLEESDLDRIRDASGTRLAEAMAAVGFDPAAVSEARWDPASIALFLELHVEQGGVLEAEGSQIGLVDIVSGSTRLRLSIAGRSNHSGATPMQARADALMGAAEIALALEGLANDPSHRGLRATVGRLELWPNSTTTIPGRVVMAVDLRDTDGDRQRRAALETVERARWICERRGLRLEWTVIADTSPTVLATWLRQRIEEVCVDLRISHRFMTSGASHDAQIVSGIAPAGIVFVPSRGGVSHVPEEWTSAADIARGVGVLYWSILRLDRFLGELRRHECGS